MEFCLQPVGPPEGLNDQQSGALAARLLVYARRAWDDLTAGRAGRLKPTHDVYLKQWQLSRPGLSGWDLILYEAQDADPCVADVIERQAHGQLVAVGDSAQAIYGWRGAGDFLTRVRAAHRLALTQSWRFGSAVAEEANVWLGVIGAELRVRGNPARQGPKAPAQADASSGMSVGDELLVAGEQGTFKVTGVSRDGSYEAYATNGTGGARSFGPEWCAAAWKDSPRSASGRVRQVPASAREARADWQARHRPGANRIEQELPTSLVSALVLGS